MKTCSPMKNMPFDSAKNRLRRDPRSARGLFLFITLLLSASMAPAQSFDAAKQVYRSSQGSVFLVYINDTSGTQIALGSAFLVAPSILITNAHVVETGTPILAVGPTRIPTIILRIDRLNDLALLGVNSELTSKPLPLASGTVSPGEPIFAIGNPEGLEKTISQGIVSGLRKLGDRNLLQITSPISHGSSGGPILNARGEVVGVAVGMLEDGQNLNFAVPALYVKSLLAQNSEATRIIAELNERAIGGDLEAMHDLAVHYDRGEEAAPLLYQACKSGNGKACTYLGDIFEGSYDVQSDPSRAVGLRAMACNAGYAFGCRTLGGMYYVGYGVGKDKVHALELYSKACTAGDRDGCGLLGGMYMDGDVVPKDPSKAVIYYSKDCDEEAWVGCPALGSMYENGDGVKQDLSRARAYFSKACAMGDYQRFCDEAQKLR